MTEIKRYKSAIRIRIRITSVICLGIQINTVARTISIPSGKVQEIVKLCASWSSKTYCSKRDLQSLLGSLLYISKCVPPSRCFLNRMLAPLQENIHVSKIPLTQSFFENWHGSIHF